MNYYIQGKGKKAGQIKAAFEKLGYDTGNLGFTSSQLYYTIEGKVELMCTKSLQNLIKTHPDYKELELPVEPKFKFKVGDWIVQNDNGTVSQITKTINGKDEYGEYRAYEHTNGYFAECFEHEYHLWTIADANDGDVLSSIRGCPFIYDKYRNQRNDLLYYYAGIDGKGNFVMKCPEKMPFHFGPSTDAVPATKEERDLLFAKMREAGYEWDADKKELRKIRSHYDIANFHAGMPVLARDYDNNRWSYVQFSHYVGECRMKFNACGIPYIQCIPFEGNEHLLGTTDMPSEEFINW